MNVAWLITLVFFTRNSASQNSSNLSNQEGDEDNPTFCRYGIEACSGEDNPENCQCFEPCKNVTCPTGSPCTITLIQGTEYKGVCRSITKPGRCPATSNTANCALQCMADADCTGVLKCCSNGCGTSCLEPMQPVNGPVVQLLLPQNIQQHTTVGPKANVTLGESYVSSEENDNNTISMSHKQEPVNFKVPVAVNVSVWGNRFPVDNGTSADCNVHGYPIPRTDSQGTISESDNLMITNTVQNDTGSYRCQVSIQYSYNSQPADPEISVDEAQGEHFGGRLSTPDISSAACALAADRGSCRDFMIKWFYNFEIGECTRFWYSGCEGNGNRFATREECKDVCVSPKGRDVCQLSKISGPCGGYLLKWYYDSERKQCNQFIYKGCFGNDNRFETREACEDRCVISDDIVIKPGRCPATSDIMNCALECTTDADCAGVFKCCSNGCGASCLEPMQPVDGPVVQPLLPQNIQQHMTVGPEANVILEESYVSSEENDNNTINMSHKQESINFEGMNINSTCQDNKHFASCDLIVKAKYCGHKYYVQFCCRSCTEAGQLPVIT